MSLLAEQVILIIALLILFLGKSTKAKRTTQVYRALQGTTGGSCHPNNYGYADPEAVASSCDFVFCTKGVSVPGLGF